MRKEFPRIPEDYVMPLNMNGLKGRMLRMPPPKNKKREVLLVYGHHSSLERMYSFAQVINDYAGVTMPDLPGFGGMDSFYKINEKPDLNTMADYVASIVRLRFKNKKFTIAGISYGFIVVTRMLQRYPDIAKQVDDLVSVVGFAHHEDFIFSSTRKTLYRAGTKFFSHKVPAVLFRNIFLQPIILRALYSKTHNAKHKFEGLEGQERQILTDFEVYLWRINDLRTHMATNHSFLVFDNCRQKIDVHVWHISVKADNYFDSHVVEQHMRVIFSGFTDCPSTVKKHMPNVIAGKKEAARIMPRPIRQLLNKQPS
ncbi:alpha/beta hydrolase [Candidatus Saccharibacteria bacterium]|nr:alpha/beta hydrolase [Candidatus Saccharibacteria bacterium]